jgi:hypothetical protein
VAHCGPPLLLDGPKVASGHLPEQSIQIRKRPCEKRNP